MAIRIHSVEEKDPPKYADQEIGALLKKTRLDKDLKIPEIAEELCIKKSYLLAIENNDQNELPDACYSIGFVKSYAAFLGLDAVEISERFKRENMSGIDAEMQEFLHPVPPTPSMIPSRTVIAASLIIVFLAYGVWHFASGPSDNMAETSTVEVATEALQAEETTVEVPAEKIVETGALDLIEKMPAPVKVSTPVEELEEQALPATADNVVTIRARQETWVQIGDGERLPLVSKVMAPGEVFRVPASDKELKLLTGNAAGIEIMVNGQLVPSLGAYGKILRNVSLNPKLLIKGQAILN